MCMSWGLFWFLSKHLVSIVNENYWLWFLSTQSQCCMAPRVSSPCLNCQLQFTTSVSPKIKINFLALSTDAGCACVAVI